MKIFKMLMVGGALFLLLTGYAAAVDKSKLKRLNGEEVRDVLVDNTLTFTAKWGRWAEYYAPDGTGHARAYGNWGSESATMKYSISDDGEICATYSGKPNWAKGNRYCGVMYTNSKGKKYYGESTQRSYQKEKIGTIRRWKFKSGDASGV